MTADEDAIVEPLAGKLLVAQAGAAGAVVNVVALVKSQPVAGPPAFFGTTYQLYRLPATRPVAPYVAAVTVAAGVVGTVAPVHIYTSYEVAAATVLQFSVAVFCVAMVAPLTGKLLVAHAGTATEAVVNVVALLISHPAAAPPAFFGITYQLYKVPAVSPFAL